jgi:molybdate transport system substrate-binding protein
MNARSRRGVGRRSRPARIGRRALLSAIAASMTLGSRALAARSGAAATDEAPVELTVYAAASTRDALQAIAAEYEKNHDVELVFNFGSSGDLAKQILAANKADLLLSADEVEMDRVAEEELVLEGSRKALLSNQLVVVEPIDPEQPDVSLFTRPFSAEQLARSEVTRLALANVDTVPAGRYAKEWLRKVKQWDAVEGKVLPAVDVRAALAAVESGGAQAGIVYRTDAARSKKARIAFAVPIEDGPKISYPLAVLRDRPHTEEAKAFAQYLVGQAAREIFERNGFVMLVPKPPAPGEK